MTDVVDKATRSRMMAGIRGRDTAPELALRKALHARGLRYRLHAKGLPGRPDLVFPKFNAVIFVHGCFWHRHEGCRYATMPATRQEFWQEKFASNVRRDISARSALEQAGWRIAIVWECALKPADHQDCVADTVAEWLASGARALEVGKVSNVKGEKSLGVASA